MKKIAIAASTVLIVLTSCQKETDNTTSTTTPPVAEKQLKKLTRVEGGQTTVFNFAYDGHKRLTSMISTDNKESFVFNYDANGNCTQLTQETEDVKNIYTYVYNNNVPATGVLKSYEKLNGQVVLQETDNLTYHVQNGKVIKISVNFTDINMQGDFPISYTGNNCSKIEGGVPVQYSAQFSYGDKKAIFPRVFRYVMDQAGLSVQFFASNEVKTVAYDFIGTSMDHTETTAYTYDAAGYPLTGSSPSTQLTFQY